MSTTPSIKAPAVSNQAPASSNQAVRHATPVLAILLGVAALVPVIPQITSAGWRTPCGAISPRARASQKLVATPRFVRVAQDQNDDDDTGDSTAGNGASPDEIQKYVAVYRAMQHNHSMTVQQAAAAQGLTVAAFRDLERRIESDDLARDDARRALAAPADGATPAAEPMERR